MSDPHAKDPRKGPPFSARVSFFRSAALLNLPEPSRIVLDHLGLALYDLTLEVFGQVPEAPDGLEITRRLLLGIASDLRTAEDQLTELALAAEESEIVAEELRLRRFAGQLAPRLREVGAALRRSAQESPAGPGGGA